MRASPINERLEARIQIEALNHELAEARALNEELMLQMTAANNAAVRMARLLARAGLRRAA